MTVRAPPQVEEKLKNAGYAMYNHSAVEICHWNKKALRGEAVCYKHKFYGIDSHKCMQITQSVAWCTSRCVFCWRPMEFFVGRELHGELDPPEVTLEKLRELRAKLLSGFGGNPKVNKKVLEESMKHPTHITFSLMGEPLLYPYVVESIKYIRENWPWVRSIFIVTAGLVPDAIERMKKENVWPTQLYVTFSAPDKDTYRLVSRPAFPDYWERYMKTLRLLHDAPVRKVARITLIKGVNDFNPEGYAKLIEIMNPHFIEVKAYMYLGYSRKRLEYENMPEHEDVKAFAMELVKHLPGYEYMNEDEASRIVVLKNRRPGMDIDPIIRSPVPNVEVAKV